MSVKATPSTDAKEPPIESYYEMCHTHFLQNEQCQTDCDRICYTMLWLAIGLIVVWATAVTLVLRCFSHLHEALLPEEVQAATYSAMLLGGDVISTCTVCLVHLPFA